MSHLQHYTCSEYVCNRWELQRHDTVMICVGCLTAADGAHTTEHTNVALQLLQALQTPHTSKINPPLATTHCLHHPSFGQLSHVCVDHIELRSTK